MRLINIAKESGRSKNSFLIDIKMVDTIVHISVTAKYENVHFDTISKTSNIEEADTDIENMVLEALNKNHDDINTVEKVYHPTIPENDSPIGEIFPDETATSEDDYSDDFLSNLEL